MDKFFGQRTCTLDATTCTQDYYEINHITVAEMLYEENLLHEIDTIQISTCHRYISICFKTRELLLDFCEHEHTILTDTIAIFIPDYYDRTRISVENLPIELPDEDVKKFLSTYVQPIGKTHYTGKKHHNKYYTTGTRVYQCIHIKQHIPRHIYHFGRNLRIRYDSQPPSDSTTKTDNNTNDKNLDDNMDKTPGPKTHQQIPETSPIPTIHDTPIITATQLALETTDTTPQPTENTQTDNNTQMETDTETETETETETQPKMDKITVQKPKQTRPTLSLYEQTNYSPQRQKHTPITATQRALETTHTTPQHTEKRPTLSHYEQTFYSPQRQKHSLYWRGYVEYNGNLRKRYDLFPNQLYQVIEQKDPKSKEFDTYFKNTFEYNDIQNEIRQTSRHNDIDRIERKISKMRKTET